MAEQNASTAQRYLDSWQTAISMPRDREVAMRRRIVYAIDWPI